MSSKVKLSEILHLFGNVLLSQKLFYIGGRGTSTRQSLTALSLNAIKIDLATVWAIEAKKRENRCFRQEVLFAQNL